ncbi:MAG TPA: sulfatase-like hydrolase/transferase [Vicinamibacterales bacterium]
MFLLIKPWPRVVLAGAAIVAVISPFLRAQAPKPNVLLVTIDTVRADHVGAYGYMKPTTPTLDRLAREGVRFADATSQAPLTGPAHAAILTGSYPGRFGVRDNAAAPLPESATTIGELFKASGYRTAAFIAAFIVDRQYGFGQGFDEFDSRFERFTSAAKLQARRPAGPVVDDALKWLAATSGAPFFAWVHLYDAHAPYDAPPAFRTRFPAAPYDGAIAYVDASVGRLIDALAQSGQLERTIVCVVADHGEGLGEHGESEHGFFLYDATLHVPWILRLPAHSHAGTVVTEQVRAIDVTPTLAAIAGLPKPSGIDGEDVMPLVTGHHRAEPPPSYAETFYPKFHFGWSEMRSVRVGEWKYIDAPKPELYDVVRDKGERQNMVTARAPLAAGLARETQRTEAAFGPAALATAPAPDPETLARLRSLGYVGATSGSASGVRGADPKDMIAGLNAFRAAMTRVKQSLQSGGAAAAIPILKQLVASNDRSYEVHLALGDAYVDTKQFKEALDEYAAARLLNPGTSEPLVAAARAHLALNAVDAAERDIADAERIEPASDEALLVRGMISEQRGDAPRALDDYAAAAAANASNTQARARLAGLALQAAQYDKARTQFEALLRMNYRPSRMHYGLGQVAQAQGNTSGAIAEYRVALRLEPTFAEARTALHQLGVQ